MKELDSFILDIKRLGINGEGLGFYNKMAIFVPGAIPGEGHNVEIVKVEKNRAIAKSLEVKNVSADRVEPKCPYFNQCGGCSTMHIDYDRMLKEKRELVIEALNRYTRLNTRKFEIKETVRSENVFGYRNKSQLPVKEYDGELKVCMLKEASNIAIPIEDCLVQDPIINKLNKDILELMKKHEITHYLAKYGRGCVRYISIRVNEKHEALVTFVCYDKSNKLRDLANDLLKHENVVSVYENFNKDKKSNQIYGEVTNHLAGEKYIVETLGDIKYQIFPTTFFQLNTKQAKTMYDIVKKVCKLSRREVVLDAYCGVGSIGLYLAKMSKEVIGIENNPSSVVAANENAKFNKIKNAKFIEGDASELLPKLIAEGYNFDVVVCDPPRTGLEQSFMDAVMKANVKRLVYVSCNQATLAKNLEVLSEKYKVMSITPVDMFPNTSLVECVVSLTLK